MYQLQTLLAQSNVLHRELLRDMANYNFEVTPNGILFAKAGLEVGGVMGNEILRARPEARQMVQRRKYGRVRLPRRAYRSLGRNEDHNLVPAEGLDRLVEQWLDAGAQIANVYVSIFEGDYTPVSGVTASSYPGDATECTAYDEGARPAFTPGSVSSASIDNTASRAEFTMNDTKTLFGGALHTASTKSSTTAPLMAAVRFSASRSVVNTDIVQVDYTFTASDT